MIEDMSKRGQITLFIIVGIVLILIVTMVFLLRGRNTSTGPTVEEVYNNIGEGSLRLYVENCIESVGVDAIYYISLQGGYFILPEGSFFDGEDYTAYYYEENVSLFPSNEFFSNQISKYVESELDYCIRDYPYSNLTIGETVVSTNIARGNVFFNVNVPITTAEGGTEKTITDFAASVDDIPLYSVIDMAYAITLSSLEEYPHICVSCLADIAKDYGFNLSTSIYDDKVLFKISNSSLDMDISLEDLQEGSEDIGGDSLQESYSFYFAGKYGNLSQDPQTPWENIFMEDIKDQVAYTNQLFLYDINASGQGLSFISFSYLIEVDNSGVMTAIPSSEDIGNHTIYIIVEDEKGYVEQDSFVLTVREKE